MKTRRFLSVLAYFLVGCSWCAYAVEPTEPVPPLPPPPSADEVTTAPKVATDPEGPPEPEVTIVQRGEDRFEEYRVGGHLYMVKVTPHIGRPYYLIDTSGNGTFVRRNSPDPGLLVPMWILFQW